MMRAMTSAIAGLKAHQTAMDVVGNNIANVNTYGFKSSSTTFRDAMYQTTKGGTAGASNAAGSNPMQIGYGASATGINVDTTQGGQDATGNAMDCYIDGQGYFEVKDSGGNVYYTRVGKLQFDSSNNLTDGNGNLIMDSGGNAITKSADDTDIKISSDGTITSVRSGASYTFSNKIGLVTFPNPGGLEEAGDSYYKQSVGSGAATLAAPSSTTGFLKTGVLESSNVDLATELSNMIVYERGYQANTKIITTADEMLQTLVNMK